MEILLYTSPKYGDTIYYNSSVSEKYGENLMESFKTFIWYICQFQSTHQRSIWIDNKPEIKSYRKGR